MTQLQFEALSVDQQLYQWLLKINPDTEVSQLKFESLSTDIQLYYIYSELGGDKSQQFYERMSLGQQLWFIYSLISGDPVDQRFYEKMNLGLQLWYINEEGGESVARDTYLSLTREQQLWYLTEGAGPVDRPAPITGLTVDVEGDTVTVAYTESPDAVSYEKRYLPGGSIIPYAADSGFQDTITDGTYTVRVRAVDSEGVRSFWTTSTSFTVDTTAPIVLSSTISGTTWLVTQSEKTNGHTGLTLTGEHGSFAPIYVSGDGVSKVKTFSLTRTPYIGEVVTFDYAPGNILDLFGNAMVEIEDAVVTHSSTEPVPEGNPPVASFTVSASAEIGGATRFTDTSTESPTSWLWDFGDGETSTEQNPIHQFATAGSFTVELTATNASGSDSDDDSVSVSVPAEWKTDIKVWAADDDWIYSMAEPFIEGAAPVVHIVSGTGVTPGRYTAAQTINFPTGGADGTQHLCQLTVSCGSAGSTGVVGWTKGEWWTVNFVVTGTSIPFGYGLSAGQAWPSQLETGFDGDELKATNNAVSSTTLQDMIDAFPSVSALSYDPTKINPFAIDGPTNSLYFEDGDATYCMGKMLELVNLAKGIGYEFQLEYTCLPRSDSPPSSFETERLAINTALRAHYNVATAHARVFLPSDGTRGSALVDIAARAAFADPTDVAVYQDGVHPTALGASYIADDSEAAIAILLP